MLTLIPGIDPRTRLCIDHDWRFLLGNPDGAQESAYDDNEWRTLTLPHDWSVEDLPPLDKPDSMIDVVEGTWRFSKGDDALWSAPGFDDTTWQRVKLPAFWEDHSDYKEDNVYGWFRRTVRIDKARRGTEVRLGLGSIDDVDEVFFNGVKIGQTGSFPPNYESAWSAARCYPVPPELINYGADNIVAVRVFDGLGGGGIYKKSIPHERSGPFDSHAVGNTATGYTVGGTAWYRKRFVADAAISDRRVLLEFDGVYMNADVWLNGMHLGNHPYGYTSFHYDITAHLKPGAENVIAVRVANEGRNTRWYSGSGIYRHVWITVTAPMAVEPWGVCITTPSVGAERASVVVRASVRNDANRDARALLRTRIVDAMGCQIASTQPSAHEVPRGTATSVNHTVNVEHPSLWSCDSPALYVAHTEVLLNGVVIDRVATTFGIRSITVDAERGFRLNGTTLKLKGACMHHDNGYLGACAFDRAEHRRVEIMKANGYNAIRTAHNPPSPAFLDACDHLGLVVIDESFDMWKVQKNGQDYHQYFEQWWQRDMDAMILRDRNHACVVMWSTGNEIPEQDKPEGAVTARMLADYTRSLDPTRPVTSALCFGHAWDKLDDYFATLDVCGYNYQREKYEADHLRFPSRVIAATESFPVQAFDYWRATERLPYVVGDFVWTGFDYLGETGIGWIPKDRSGWELNSYPWTVAFCGDIDLCGFKRPASYYRDAVWSGRPELSLFVKPPSWSFGIDPRVNRWEWEDVVASWNWEGSTDRPLEVRAYASCESVRLLLNGRDLGVCEVSDATRLIASWEVPFEPGTLTAVGYIDGKEVVRSHLRTAGPVARIRLTPDRTVLTANEQDLAYVTVEALDAHGVRVPTHSTRVSFSVEGPGTIAGVGNGDPTSTASIQARTCRVYGGRCLAIVRTGRTPGAIRFSATVDGLVPAFAEMQSVAG